MSGLLERTWFAPAPAARLGVLRVVVGGFSLWYLARRRRMLARIAETGPELFEPVGIVKLLDRPLDPRVVRATTDAALAANLAFLLGWRHRVSGPAYSGLLLWVLSYRNSWSMIYHTDNTLVLHALILGLSPSSDAVSLDARRAPAAAGATAADESRYGWPIQLMNTVTTLAYFVAGVAKVAGPLGRQWTSGESLRGQVAVDGLRKELLGGGAAPAASLLYDKLWLWRAAAAGTMVVELGAPAVLPFPRLARLWAVGAFGMHWAVLAIMKITFRHQLSGVAFAPFFPVERAPGALLWVVRRLLGR